jgi:uncharacterized DUF497 family protein
MSYTYVLRMADIVVTTLVVDDHRIEHIARHQVTIEEVLEVVSGDYVYIKGHHDRLLLIGPTSLRRFLTVVVGRRIQPNTYGLVTARPASREERSLYRELEQQQGGEEKYDET